MIRVKQTCFSFFFLMSYVFSYTLDNIINVFEAKLNKTILSLEKGKYPHYTVNGKWYSEPYNKWTSGFFPGCLWELYDITKNNYWMEQAIIYQENVKENQNNNNTHDVGFMILNTYAKGYELSKNKDYLPVVLKTADTLSTRYSNVTKVIKSWESCDKSEYKVIIDNMMNLELLWWANKHKDDNGGNQPKYKWDQIANAHAITTSKNHFRKDFSTYHVLNYNQQNGLIIYKGTHQGYDFDSTWARGQAWAIYGYVIAYKYTNNADYFNIFEKAYQLYKEKTKNDLVPNWDLDDPERKYEDTSASAIISCALLEISILKKNASYFKQSKAILMALLKNYISNGDDDKFDAILLHGTSNFPKNLYDQGLIYGDFYFIKAVNLYHKHKNKFEK
ncbi:Six-hairpin glycosidase-like protein [Cunninghamella echinulata]|nr:Six-hairpin glycosidase-like protein [Cunninghamella echinulata]